MDIIEMHEFCDLLIDKANAPWFTPEEKDKFINLAQIEFLDSSYRFFEVNEEVREKLLPLVRSTFIAGPALQFNLSAINDFRYILGVRGNFPDGCGGVNTCSISPVQIDDEVDSQKDPFNKADDFFPQYVQENDGTNNVGNILANTAATNIVIKYLKTPVDVVNDIANPLNNVNSEFPDSSHEEIINIAVRKMLASVQDQLHYQMQSNEEQKQ
jgi:hypothetical protein